MRLYKIFLTAIIIFLINTQIQSAIEPIEELSFTIPGLTGPIEQFYFNDINNDNIPEVLVTDGEILILYSISLDSILFSDSIPPTIAPYILSENYKILFDDVNRDSMPDILFARYSQIQDTIPYFSTTYSVDLNFYDASTNYENLSIINLYTDTLQSINFIIESSGLSILRSFDINKDGYNELLVSFESFYEQLWGFTLEAVETNGKSINYYSFPDSINWASNNFMKQYQNYDDITYFGNFLYNTKGESHGSGQWNVSTITPAILDNLGQQLSSFDLINDHLIVCNTVESYWHTENSNYLISGKLIKNLSKNFILMKKSYSEHIVCFDNGMNFLDSSGSELTLQNFIEPDSLEEIWTIDVSNHTYTNFLYHPLESGYFFAFEGDTLIEFKGTDGSIYQKNDTLPTGTYQWVYPFNDSLPRLAITTGNTIKLINFDISTGIDDYTNYNQLPNTFTLSQNYPNPFNPTTVFSYALPTKGNVKADIYNILGQRVATLIDTEQPAGEHQLEWDASSQSSGIYLFKLTYNNQTKTLKTMLLK